MNYKTLNTIRKAPFFLLFIIYRLISFAVFPMMIVLIFFCTDWEDEQDRNRTIKCIKSDISFGFWK